MADFFHYEAAISLNVNPVLVSLSLSWKIQGQITAVHVVSQVRKKKLLLAKDSERVWC